MTQNEQETAHYFFVLMEFAELCKTFGQKQVLYDLAQYQDVVLYPDKFVESVS